jgi:MFS family permease
MTFWQFVRERNAPALLGYALFTGMLSAGYYYNLTFVQLGLEDFAVRRLGLSAQVVAHEMALFALLTCLAALAGGYWMGRRGWGRRFRFKLRLAFFVVLAQTALTAICPLARHEMAFLAWLISTAVVLGLGVPALFSMAVDLVPTRDRGVVAGLVTALAYFAAETLSSSWTFEAFRSQVLLLTACGTLLTGILAFARHPWLDQLARQHHLPDFGRGRFTRCSSSPRSHLVPLIAAMFAIYFIDSLGFLRLLKTPVYMQSAWQSPDLHVRLFIAAVHVAGALAAGILYTALSERHPVLVDLWHFRPGPFTVKLRHPTGARARRHVIDAHVVCPGGQPVYRPQFRPVGRPFHARFDLHALCFRRRPLRLDRHFPQHCPGDLPAGGWGLAGTAYSDRRRAGDALFHRCVNSHLFPWSPGSPSGELPMKPRQATFLLALLALFLSACSEAGLYRLVLVTEGKHTLDESMRGDLVVLGGAVTLTPDVTLQGSLHLLRGEATLAGRVTGDVTQLGGRLVLQDGARLEGSLQTTGGEVLRSPLSEIAGSVNRGAGVLFSDVPDRSPAAPLERLRKAMFDGLLLGLAAATLVHFFPGPLLLVSESVTHHPAVSLAMGFLVAVAGISLLVTMAYTILLIPVALLGLLVLGAALAIGWIAWGITLGLFLFRLFKINVGHGWVAFTGTLAFGLAQAALSLLPYLGSGLNLLVALTGFGAVFLTRFGLQRFRPNTIEAPIT